MNRPLEGGADTANRALRVPVFAGPGVTKLPLFIVFAVASSSKLSCAIT